MLNYIPDGYDEPGYIKENPGLHGEFRFRFRPMLVQERTINFNAADKLPPEQQDLHTAKCVRARLISWEHKDQDGNAVPISETTILRLKPALFHRLSSIVYGMSAGDPDPQWRPADADAHSQAIINAAIEGTDYRSERELADAKN
jgi:hypothetical protein